MAHSFQLLTATGRQKYASGKGAAMGSNAQQIRLQQMELFEKKITARRAVLAQRGIEGTAQDRDKILQHLIAEMQRSLRALRAINARNAVIEQARTQRQAKAARKAEAPKQKKKKTEAPPEKEKKDKKAKKAEKAEKTQNAQH